MEPVVLRTERLELSVPRASDIDEMTSYCQDPEIARFVPIPQPYTAESARSFIEDYVPASWASGREFSWAMRDATRVTDASAGAFLGMIGAVPKPDGSLSVGYWLGAEHRGQGYVPEAARAVIEWARETLGSTTAIWWAIAGNTSSARVAEKLGFTRAGTGPLEGGFRGVPAEGWFAQLTLAG
jgi:RimJ/RimL family protein N-acetyltransferase